MKASMRKKQYIRNHRNAWFPASFMIVIILQLAAYRGVQNTCGRLTNLLSYIVD